ncbi:unnamed protein product [Sphagnum troendelagicum]
METQQHKKPLPPTTREERQQQIAYAYHVNTITKDIAFTVLISETNLLIQRKRTIPCFRPKAFDANTIPALALVIDEREVLPVRKNSHHQKATRAFSVAAITALIPLGLVIPEREVRPVRKKRIHRSPYEHSPSPPLPPRDFLPPQERQKVSNPQSHNAVLFNKTYSSHCGEAFDEEQNDDEDYESSRTVDEEDDEEPDDFISPSRLDDDDEDFRLNEPTQPNIAERMTPVECINCEPRPIGLRPLCPVRITSENVRPHGRVRRHHQHRPILNSSLLATRELLLDDNDEKENISYRTDERRRGGGRRESSSTTRCTTDKSIFNAVEFSSNVT